MGDGVLAALMELKSEESQHQLKSHNTSLGKAGPLPSVSGNVVINTAMKTPHFEQLSPPYSCNNSKIPRSTTL